MLIAWSASALDVLWIKQGLMRTVTEKQISVKVKTSRTLRRYRVVAPIKTDTAYSLLVLTAPLGETVVKSWYLKRVKKNEKRLDLFRSSPHY